MRDTFTDLLSAYLDLDLPREQADQVERHLDTCAECRATLEALARVKSQAASLVDPPVPTDLWAGIASRIGPAGSTNEVPAPRPVVIELPRRRRVAWFQPQWVMAAAAFAVVAAGALWLAHDRLTPSLRAGNAGDSTLSRGVSDDASLAGYDPTRIEGEIADLQRALDRGRGRLDPKTVQVLEENLRIIHKAAQDARTALEQDPANRELQDYLASSVQRKLDFVRRAATLAGV